MITIIGSVNKKIKELRLAIYSNYWFFKKDSTKQSVLSNIINARTPRVIYEDGTEKLVADSSAFDIEYFGSFIGSTGIHATNVTCTIDGQTVKARITAKIYEESTWKTIWQGTNNIYGYLVGNNRVIELNGTVVARKNMSSPVHYILPLNTLYDYLGENLFVSSSPNRSFRITYYAMNHDEPFDYGVYYNGTRDSIAKESVEKTIVINNLKNRSSWWNSKINNALILGYIAYYEEQYPYNWYDQSFQIGINYGYLDIISYSNVVYTDPNRPVGFRIKKIEVLD